MRPQTPEQRKAAIERSCAWDAANPQKARARSKRWRENNRERSNKQARTRYRKAGKVGRAKQNARRTPASTRNEWLRRKYGITSAQWLQIFESQNRQCACCGADRPGSRLGWHTDHDHARVRVRGEKHIVRGIVCHHCNVMLGAARDQGNRLQNGIDYLARTA